MSVTRRLLVGFLVLFGIAASDVPRADGLSCPLRPYGEDVFIELEAVTEDGVEIMDSSYGSYTTLLNGNAHRDNIRLWVVNSTTHSWWQDFE